MINNETKLIGLIGHPVAHSKSPQMHNTMFDNLDLNYKYFAFDVQQNQLEQAIEGVKALNISGLNVTIPHKVNVMTYLDEISDEARAIGAVNTIVNLDGKLIGYNTDGQGYVRSLIEETGINIEGKKIIILGAGGAARAISYTLSKQLIAELIIANRNLEKAKQLQHILEQNVSTNVISYDEIKSYIEEVDIVVNTTSIGMHPRIDQSPINKERINSNHLISDIIYNPLETKLIKDAIQQGAQVHTGLGMFIYQAVIAFEKWTGVSPNPKVMRQSVL